MLFTEDGKPAVYDPRVFDVSTVDHAKAVILGQVGCDTEERWTKETPHLVSMILERVDLNSESIVLDYGCGIGRLAKELIGASGCTVVGADISSTMRALANYYVADDRFFACAPSTLCCLLKKVDLVIAVWVLQHVKDPFADAALIKKMLKPTGNLFLVNNLRRAVPVDVEGQFAWKDDRQDIRAILRTIEFHELKAGKLPASTSNDAISNGTFWAWYSP